MPDRILVVEDDPNDAELLMYALEAQRLARHIHIVRDGAEALDYLHCRGDYADRSPVNPSLVLLSKIEKHRHVCGEGLDRMIYQK